MKNKLINWKIVINVNWIELNFQALALMVAEFAEISSWKKQNKSDFHSNENVDLFLFFSLSIKTSFEIVNEFRHTSKIFNLPILFHFAPFYGNWVLVTFVQMCLNISIMWFSTRIQALRLFGSNLLCFSFILFSSPSVIIVAVDFPLNIICHNTLHSFHFENVCHSIFSCHLNRKNKWIKQSNEKKNCEENYFEKCFSSKEISQYDQAIWEFDINFIKKKINEKLDYYPINEKLNKKIAQTIFYLKKKRNEIVSAKV